MKLVQALDVHQAIVRKQMEKLAHSDVPESVWRPEIAGRVSAAVTRALITPLTKVIRFTGPAMAPTLNRQGIKDKDAFEFLLVRQLPDPNEDNVHKGDIVCLKHPIGVQTSSLLVRRVTACGGEYLTSKQSEYQLAADVVWVEADNHELEPPHVEDSRTFGPVPLGNILGRCIYAFASAGDQAHIENSEGWKSSDAEVVDIELTEDLTKELEECRSSLRKASSSEARSSH
jgi:hypothetical protein